MAETLGDLEQVLLFALVRLGGQGHGAPVIAEVEQHTGRRVAPGALYTVFSRLEAKGLVTSWIGDSSPHRGGRRRKVYRIEPQGALALRAWYSGIQGLAEGVTDRLDLIAEGRAL